MKFHELLEKYRESQHPKLTKTELANRLDVSLSYYQFIEAGRRPPPTFDLCQKLATILELNKKAKKDFFEAAFQGRASDDDKKFLTTINPSMTHTTGLDGVHTTGMDGTYTLPPDNSMKPLFKNKIKELRHEKGVTQQALANKLECGLRTICHWEQNRNSPNSTQRKKLCTFFGITEAELFENSEKDKLAKENKQLAEENRLLKAQVTLPSEIQEAFQDSDIREALQDPKVLKALAFVGKGKKETRTVITDLLEKIPELDIEKLRMVLKLAGH